jgi:hypothetical protein
MSDQGNQNGNDPKLRQTPRESPSTQGQTQVIHALGSDFRSIGKPILATLMITAYMALAGLLFVINETGPRSQLCPTGGRNAVSTKTQVMTNSRGQQAYEQGKCHSPRPLLELFRAQLTRMKAAGQFQSAHSEERIRSP